MVKLYLYRIQSNDEGSVGIYFSPDLKFIAYSLELPWRENEQNFSCIPKGNYICKIYKSPRFGYVFKLIDVEGRSYILIHSGNYAGDTKKDYVTDTAGCIMLGSSIKSVLVKKKKQIGIFQSRITLRKFMTFTNNKSFQLEIR